MILSHKESLTGRQLKYNWGRCIGDWIDPLYNLLETDYVDNLVTFIDQKYKSGKDIFPNEFNLFKAFHFCRYSDLKVVIISNNAPLTKEASGIGVGINIPEGKIVNLPPMLNSIKECIDDTVYGHIKNEVSFDTSLQDIAEQGVLFLNTSLTTEITQSHKEMWKGFIRETIKTINKEKKDVIFVFLNSDNEELEKFIDLQKHYILRNTGGILPFYSTIFTKIDDIIEEKYGSQSYIQW